MKLSAVTMMLVVEVLEQSRSRRVTLCRGVAQVATLSGGCSRCGTLKRAPGGGRRIALARSSRMTLAPQWPAWMHALLSMVRD